MGQKVNPKGLRLKIVEDWDARWFASKNNYTDKLTEDMKIYSFINKELKKASIGKITIDRYAKKVKIVIYSARPAVIIGSKGVKKEELENKIKKFLGKDNIQLFIQDVKKPEINANIVAQRVAEQIERRVAFRRAMKKAIDMAMQKGAKGIKISCSGRLAGAEMARTEWYLEGRVPLHTLRAKIDYGTAEANTKVGIIGIKVWIFIDEIFGTDDVEVDI